VNAMKKLACLMLFCFAAGVSADPGDSVVRIPSHGGSGTVIATGPGWTLVLSCAHCFEGKDRNVPIVIDMKHPAAGGAQKVGVKLKAVGHTEVNDLSLIELNFGPVPYVTPVGPVGYSTDGCDCWSIGFDEMAFPVHVRPAKILGPWGADSAKTDTSPWHGRSGGALIEKKTGYLMGVVSAYTGERLADKKRFPKDTPLDTRLAKHEYQRGYNGVYVSLPSIHRFLVKAGVMARQPLLEVQPQIQFQFQSSPSPSPFGGCPGGNCPTPRYGPPSCPSCPQRR
jgi:hypothetical protein